MCFVRLIILSVVFLLSATASGATEGTSDNWTPGDNDLRILEIRVAQYKLKDVLAAYQHGNILLIPLGALSEMLDLTLVVSPGDGTAQGFIFNEKNTVYSVMTTVDLTLRPPLYKHFQFTYGLNHSLRADLTEISASASKSVGSFNLSLGARYNTDSIISLDARFSLASAGNQDKTNGYHMRYPLPVEAVFQPGCS